MKNVRAYPHLRGPFSNNLYTCSIQKTSLCPGVSEADQTGLSHTWSQTPKTGFLVDKFIRFEWHRGLLHKLRSTGCSEKVTQWFASSVL